MSSLPCISSYRSGDHLTPGSPSFEFDDDAYTSDDAHRDAENELMATGYAVSLAASEACPNDTAEVVTPAALLNTDDYFAIRRPMHELMAVMSSGNLKAAESALREWRDRLPGLMAREISERADELMAEHGDAGGRMNTVCPLPTCIDTDACAERRSCILILSPAERIRLLAPADFPYPLRRDPKPRAVYPQGVQQ